MTQLNGLRPLVTRERDVPASWLLLSGVRIAELCRIREITVSKICRSYVEKAQPVQQELRNLCDFASRH